MANQVRARRELKQLAQGALADAAGLSRQSLSAIEAGRTTPSVSVALRIARCLDSDVESLFGTRQEHQLEAELASGAAARQGRVIVGSVRERWVAHPLLAPHFAPSQYAADGFVTASRGGRVKVEVSRAPLELRENLLLGGCAPGLGVLADRLNGARGSGRFRWLMQANGQALTSLAHGHTHLAGVHLAKDSTEKLARTVARYLPTERGEVVALATWEAGLVVAAGNPRTLRTVADLADSKLRIALREPGSGARQQLDRMLKREGISNTSLLRRAFEVRSHMDVAHAVALGAADVGFSIRAAAIAYELGFVPLVEERFDLIIPEDLGDDPRVVRMLDALSDGQFRRELETLGYDARVCADRVTSLSK